MTVTPEDTDLVRLMNRLVTHRHLDHNERRWVEWAADAIERLSAEKEAAEAEADRLATSRNIMAALAAHDARRRGQS